MNEKDIDALMYTQRCMRKELKRMKIQHRFLITIEVIIIITSLFVLKVI